MLLQYDERKNVINLRKHGIPLEDGLAAINDPDAIVLFDEKYSDLEERYVAIGRCGSVILFNELGLASWQKDRLWKLYDAIEKCL